jgi:hypothetical protein
MADRAPLIVFTAAHPGQGGMGHVNEQPPEEWAAKFESVGMTFDREATNRLRDAFVTESVADWFAANALVLRR